MKKLLITLGFAAAAALSFSTVTVSAQSYDDNDWQSDRCSQITDRLETMNGNFDQDNDRRLAREQRLIDRQNDLGCPTGTVTDTLVKNGNFTTLVTAVTAAGLAGNLSAPGNLTVFAPTDQAFAALPAGTVDALLKDIPTLTNILTNHVIAGKVDAEAAEQLSQATALNGNTLHITTDDCGNLYINDAHVILHDIQASNGIIHVVDSVILP